MSKKKRRKSQSWSVLRWAVVAVALGVLLVGGLLLAMKARSGWQIKYNKGALHMRAGETAAAILCFEESLELNPDHIETYISLVRGHVKLKEFDKAQGRLDEALAAGLDKHECALWTARVRLARAKYRLASANENEILQTTADILEEEIGPALKSVSATSIESEKSATLLLQGRLWVFAAKVHMVREDVYKKAYNNAIALEKFEEAKKAKQLADRDGTAARMGYAQAIAGYRRGVALDPSAVEPRVSLARLYMSRYPPLARPAAAILGEIGGKKASRREVLHLLTWAHSASRNYEKVLELTEVPDGTNAQLGDAQQVMRTRALLELGRFDDAREALPVLKERKVSRHPYIRYMEGRLLLQENNDKDAMIAFQDAMPPFDRAVSWPEYMRAEIPRVFTESAFLLGRTQIKAGVVQQARANYRTVVETMEDALRVSGGIAGQELIDCYFEACMFLARDEETLADDAAGYARRAVMVNPTSDEAYNLALVIHDKGMLDELKQNMVHMRLAGLMKRGHFDQMTKIGEAARSAVAKPDMLMRLMADGLVRYGFARKALGYYDELLTKNPKDTQVRHAYAVALLELRRYLDAQKQLKIILDEKPRDKQAIMLLARLATAAGKPARVAEWVEKLLQIDPDDMGARVWLADAYGRAGQHDRAITILEKVRTEKPDDIRLRGRLFSAYLAAARRADAKVEAVAVIGKWPKRPEGYVYALLHLRDGELDKALEVFQKGHAQLPNYAYLQVLVGVALQAKGDIAGAIEQWAPVAGGDKRTVSVIHRNLAKLMLAGAYAALGDMEKVSGVDLAVVDENPGRVVAMKSLWKDIAGLPARDRLKAAITLNRFLAWTSIGWPDAQKEETDALLKILPESPMARGMAATVMVDAGEFDKSIAGLEDAVKAHPEIGSLRFLLARACSAAGKKDRAQELMISLVAETEGSMGALMARELGTMYEAAGKIEKAIEAYRVAIAKSERDVLALNNLAWILATKKKEPKAALPLVTKAVARAPEMSQVLDTAGWVYHLLGRDAEAVVYLRRAKVKAPVMPEIRYHLGAALAGIGLAKDAILELNEAMALSPEFNGSTEAKILLSELRQSSN